MAVKVYVQGVGLNLAVIEVPDGIKLSYSGTHVAVLDSDGANVAVFALANIYGAVVDK